jgi:protocatechuate 3,4-dioxygenase, alpha subunit
MSEFGQTPSQTVGPFFAYGLVPTQYSYPFRSLFDNRLAQPFAVGEHVRLFGTVRDGDGKPIEDALLEIVQVDAAGNPVNTLDQAQTSGFRGFGRVGTGTLGGGRYEFFTVKPGATDGAPHITMVVMMRGILLHAFTRVYFEDEAAANAADDVLNAVPAERRNTLVARRIASGAGVGYEFDIHMQGERETVFFDL